MGSGNQVAGVVGVAVGLDNIAEGGSSVALGMRAQALAHGSLAIGSNDADSTGEGGSTVAAGADRGTAIVTGASVLAAGGGAISFGTAPPGGRAKRLDLHNNNTR